MRLFIAIDLPAPIQKQVGQILPQLAPLRIPNLLQIHLTLKFLGEVNLEQKEKLISALDRIHQRPFELILMGTGCFPNLSRPRVLWLGVQRSEPLARLQKKIEEITTSLGWPKEKRSFHPHLTLARIKNPRKSPHREFCQNNSTFQSDSFIVKAFHLYSSKLNPQGAIHHIENSFLLTEEV